MTDLAPSMPMIDADAIHRWCDVVFGYLDGPVAIRMLRERGAALGKPWSVFTDVAAAATRIIDVAPRAAQDNRAVFIVPATLKPTGRARAEDVVATGVVLVDLDEGDISAKRAHLVGQLGPASLEIASGGHTAEGQPRLHLYWRLTEAATGADLATVCDLRARIAAAVGGDPSFASPHQPIRVAGTLNAKDGRLEPVRIIGGSAIEQDLAEFAARVAELPPMGSAAHSPAVRVAGSSQRVQLFPPRLHALGDRVIRAGGIDGITRFDALSSVIGHWVRQARLGRCSRNDAWRETSAWNASHVPRPGMNPGCSGNSKRSSAGIVSRIRKRGRSG